MIACSYLPFSASPNTTLITIHDELDVPTFAFAESQYAATETNRTLSVVILRYGDLSATQKINCITTSVTARGGLDFISLRSDQHNSVVEFQPGMTLIRYTVRLTHYLHTLDKS